MKTYEDIKNRWEKETFPKFYVGSIFSLYKHDINNINEFEKQFDGLFDNMVMKINNMIYNINMVPEYWENAEKENKEYYKREKQKMINVVKDIRILFEIYLYDQINLFTEKSEEDIIKDFKEYALFGY